MLQSPQLGPRNYFISIFNLLIALMVINGRVEYEEEENEKNGRSDTHAVAIGALIKH
jgi:hypothetical protein